MEQITVVDRLVPLIAAIYIRVSTTDQEREGHSLDFQLADSEHLIARNGWTKGPVYQDVESGYNPTREGYQRMLRDAKAGKFQTLIVWRLDRFTRNTLDGLRAVDYLVSLGIEIVSVTETLDFKTARGKRNLREDLVDAEYYRDKLKENVLPGMIRGVLKGHYQGARYVRYGFRYDKPNKRLVEVDEELKVLRVAYRFRADGLAVYSIALRLYEMGYRNRVGKPFTTHQLEVMLRCPFYVDGHLVWRYRNEHEEWQEVRSKQPVVKPVIDAETWARVQAVNQDRRREMKGPRPGRVNSPYILQKVLKCCHCRKNMVGQTQITNHQTGKRERWYVCGQRVSRTRHACPHGQYVKAERAEPLAFDILKRIMQHPQLIELTKQKIKEMLEQSHPVLSRRMAQLREIIRRVKREQEKWREAYFQEAITTLQYKEENLRLVREQESTEEELRVVQAKLDGADVFAGRVEQVFELLRDFGAVWEKMTHVQQRVVYRGVFENLYVEGQRWSRRLTVSVFALKEPFRSWYDGKVWEGPLVLREGGSVTVTSSQDNTLCQNFMFSPMDDGWMSRG